MSQETTKKLARYLVLSTKIQKNTIFDQEKEEMSLIRTELGFSHDDLIKAATAALQEDFGSSENRPS